MSPKPKTDSSFNMSIKDMTSSFLSVLDNNFVITKLALILSASISLTFDEKMVSVMNKLDSTVNDNKIIQKILSVIENENAKLKQEKSTLRISAHSFFS